jgi:rare lipoprotein A
MPRKSLITVLTVVILLFSAIAGSAAETRKKSAGKGLLSGIASIYASRFHGRPTASGERYNHKALTAAHRFYPFGTLVRVFNLKNGRSIVVRINDRGPFHRGRVIDLSAAAAKALGFLKHGMTKVKLEVIHFPGKGHPPKDLPDLVPEPEPESDVEAPGMSADPALTPEP